MKRGLIIGGGVLGVIVLGAIAVFVLVLSNIDTIVKAGVEEYGSEITGVKVTLNEVDISATSGKGALRGLTVGNPAGFNTDSAFKLGEVSIDLDVGSVTGDTIVVREIVIAAPQVTYELGAEGSNIDVIKNNVDSYIGPRKGGAKQAPGEKAASKDDGGDQGPKLVVENLYIRDGKVSVSSALLKGKKLSAPLPAIHLKDIGKKEGGVTPGEVAEKIMAAVSSGAGKAVASLNVEGLLSDIGKGATETLEKGLEGVTKELGAGAGSVGGDAAETLEKGAQEAGKALKSLFGK